MPSSRSVADHGRPAKRAKLLMDDDASSSADEDVTLQVNEEYARRFEHNKKREDKQRLEEKYGRTNIAAEDDDASGSDDSSSDDEDDEGMLATVDLDAEISATLNAIRNKDPVVYDKDATFYSEWDPDNLQNGEKKEKPMYLRDYHRKNLLEGNGVVDEDEDAPPIPYVQEQAALKKDLVKSINAAKGEDSEGDSDDDFLVRKSKKEEGEPAGPPKPKIHLDIEEADKDPENFLSNFFAARAWTSDSPRFQPLESDDDEEDRRADEYEHAYNMRFENPQAANEKLMTHARDAAAKYSVRRDEKSQRKKQRDKEREKKEAKKRERDEEKARLRKLRIEEMEEKVQMIKEAAGLESKDFKVEDWADVLEADWDDDRWDQEMQKRFGEDYYGEKDTVAGLGDAAMSDSDDNGDGKGRKKNKKPKKPKWDDEIDIKDIISDYNSDKDEKPAFTHSDIDEEDGGVPLADGDAESDDEDISRKKKKRSKKDQIDAKRAARRERRLIETFVDQNLDVELAAKQTVQAPTKFRYRETSPTTFGLTARDILLADDTALNQFAGLKKMAAWRDPQKKKKDKKSLGKKARLRQWRKETFGDEEGPKFGFGDYVGKKLEEKGVEVPRVGGGDIQMKDAGAEEGVDIKEGKRKKRSKKRKSAVVEK